MAAKRFQMALVQWSPADLDPAKNLDLVQRAALRAESAGADWLIFPELWLSGYAAVDRGDRAGLRAAAARMPQKLMPRLIDLAAERGLHLVLGLPWPADDGSRKIFNATALVGPDGLIGIHRKTMLPQGKIGRDDFHEQEVFAFGDELEPFETPFGRVGMMICYEAFFPEIARCLAVKGADLIVCPSAAPAPQQDGFDLILRARAMENSVGLAYVNLPRHDGLDFFGRSRFISPGGKVMAQSGTDGEDLVVVEVDLEQVQRVRAKNPNLGDRRRRPAMFRALTGENS